MTDVTVAFVEVGQGDCTVAVDHDSAAAIMIDCPAGKSALATAELRAERADRLELVVATHSDLDHFGGIYPVVTSVPTAALRLNEAPAGPTSLDEKKQLKAALRAIAGLPRRGVSLDDARRGHNGSIDSIDWSILTPTKAQLIRAQGVASPNHASAVIRLAVGNCDFLVAGDADLDSWNLMLGDGIDVSADVLLFPHHGAVLGPNGGEAARVLAAIGAAVVVLSFGAANVYGHPSAATLAALATQGPKVVATAPLPPGPVAASYTGTVRFDVDGINVRMRP